MATLPGTVAHLISPLIKRNLNCISFPKQNMTKKAALCQESCPDPKHTVFCFYEGTGNDLWGHSLRGQGNNQLVGEACRSQVQATGPPKAYASSPTRMLNRGRGQQSWLENRTQKWHAVPSLPTWTSIPGSFPNGSSPHEMATTLNLNNVAVDTHGCKCNVNLSLISFWKPRAGPQFQ